MYNNIAFYHDIDHKDKNVDVEVGLVVDKLLIRYYLGGKNNGINRNRKN